MGVNAEKSLVDGLRAVELHYRAIRNISSGQIAAYQSQTRLNSPKLGVLTPDKYRDVCEITNQAVKLFYLELIQALEAYKTFVERELNFSWVSVYMPVRFLREAGAEKTLLEYFSRYDVPTSRICFELSENLLEEKDGRAAQVIQHMRNRGFHFMIVNFGGDTCPMMRLSGFPVDYVLLSPEVANFLGKDERSDNAVKSIIGFVNDIGAEPIADGVFNSRQAETLYTFECAYCAGSLAGKYMTERYVRRKTDS
ncbi:MAG: EAL domain-containing protein [Ruminococcus sp.]|nr:EAL domain-containing protein [Ruminococcus sp.]